MNGFALPILGDPPRAPLDERLSQLDSQLGRYVREGALVTFSGGVDSAFLLWRAHAAAAASGRLLALTTVSASTPAHDKDDAASFAQALGVEHVWAESRELEHEAYVANGSDRCYHCKSELFEIAHAEAAARGLSYILYGFNESDRGDVRPGHRAASERGVVAPLADARLTKDEIRATLRGAGIDLADKPSSPCLASRLAPGVRVDAGRLADVAALEGVLRRGGVTAGRVRVCAAAPGHFLRIEVPPPDLEAVVRMRDALIGEGRARGYRWVTLDLEGYRMGGAG